MPSHDGAPTRPNNPPVRPSCSSCSSKRELLARALITGFVRLLTSPIIWALLLPHLWPALAVLTIL